ncbi:MAG: S8 family serine peptidase [Planctomycetota bacterium]|nr:S8 family serine peptidase [Planctomycetota bacterium]
MPDALFRRRAVILCAVLASGVACLVWRGSATRDRRGAPAAAQGRPAAPAVRGPGHRWGGAWNSAQEDGTGFFDRGSARRFAAEVQPALRKYVVDLNARAFLPVAGAEALPEVLGDAGRDTACTAGQASSGTAGQASRGARTVYLQFHDHPRADERRQLAAQGLELLSYSSGYAWMARGTPDAFKAASGLPFVRAVARVDARDKLHPAVFKGETPAYAQAEDGRTRFMLLAQPGTSAELLARELAGAAALAGLEALPRPPSVLGPRFEIVAARELARQVAALDAAACLSFVPPPAAPRPGASRDATTDAESNIGAVRDSAPNLSGAGVTVAVREVGKMDQHVDVGSRLTYIDNDGDLSGNAVNHATAVTGVIGSDGVAQPAAKGVAPAVAMLAYALTNDTFLPADVMDAATRGARLSNHSYGPAGLTTWGDYDTISADWDAALRTGDLLGMFAGNEESGGQYGHIDFFVGAKNTICVSATNASARAGSATVPKADGIAWFAEYGPMNDGRVKPDLVAFGDNVTLDLDSNQTQTNNGTSFSTPAVTGVAALVFEHYKAVVGWEPSAALAKALLCNSATDLGAPGPDAVYGFGMLNAQEAIATIDRRQSATLTPFYEDVLSNGGSRTFTVNLQSVTQVKVTLCWLDVAGTPAAAKALVNDLDLELQAPDGTKFYPYSLDPQNPAAAATRTGPNRVDPIEQVVVDSPASGTWTIVVNGTSFPQQGLQSFAVCVSQPAVPPALVAVISASPTSGPAPLTVSFSARNSVGSANLYSWSFGDGTTQEGGEVSHPYTSAGFYTVLLTLDGTASASQVIMVTKRTEQATAGKARATLSFWGDPTAADDNLQFTLTAAGLQKTRLDAQAALRNGSYQDTPVLVKLGGGPDGTPPPTKVGEAALDNRATFRSGDLNVKLNPLQGQLRVQLRSVPLEEIFSAAGMTRTPDSAGFHPLAAEIEMPDATYRATLNFTYKVSPNSGRATAR